LCIGAVLAATRERPLPAAFLLGLALATKPWALVAVPPVMLAASRGRAKVAVVSLSMAAALTLPLLVASPSGFGRTATAVQGVGLAETGAPKPTAVEVRPYTIWRLFAVPSRERHASAAERELLGYELPN